MKKFSFTLSLITSLLFLFVLISCDSQSPTGSEAQSISDFQPEVSLQTKPVAGYPMFDSHVFKAHGKNYVDGTLMLDNGSIFIVEKKALTPPPDVPFGDRVEITWLAEFDEITGQLTYTFGPSGCKFDPPAKVKMDYSKLNLGLEVPQLFLIDGDGNFIEEYPENIDLQNKKVTMSIEHFSRYAIGQQP